MNDTANWIDDWIQGKIIQILCKYGINSIRPQDMTVMPSYVSDIIKEEKKISSEIVDLIWPSHQTLDVYHFTNRDAAVKILDSQTFRLTSLLKRKDEDEISAFCKRFKLDGYLEKTDNITYFESQIMPMCYYASFAESDSTPETQEKLWELFSNSDGVRFKFRITTACPKMDLRKMVYDGDNKIQLISEIMDYTRSKGREFVFGGISRICAFYLCGDYEREKEIRLLYKKYDTINNVKKDGAYEYVEFPFGQMTPPGYQIDLLEVCSNSSAGLSTGAYKFIHRK